MRTILASILLLLSACGGSSAAGNASTLARDTYALSTIFDPGMSHVAITVVLSRDGAVVQALDLGRFLNACGTDRYEPIAGAPPPAGSVLAIGCDTIPELVEDGQPVLVRVVRRGDQLVGEWSAFENGRATPFVEAGAIALPAGASLELDGDASDFYDQLTDANTVRSCHAYPGFCED